ncbi:MAG: uroporphyrinogen decarboxylase family protein [Oscillospiraceae bacterium]|nr:uroporphyrinogen decarboxylase family protein [Oscillospiraceae bacterium]
MSEKERLRLRKLAKKQLELSESERNKQLYIDWEAHGRADGSSRPMVTVEHGTFSEELIEPRLRCESEQARALERMLLGNTLNFEYFKDDTIVRGYIPYEKGYRMTPFGLQVKCQETGGLGYHYISQLHDLADDFHLLKKSTYQKFSHAGGEDAELVQDILGDILPVKKTGAAWYISFLQDIVHIMSTEDMFIAMSDEPELFHQMCGMLADDHIELMERVENKGLLRPTNRDVHLCQGSMCFTSDLPSEGEELKMSQIWGYMDAQEAQGISPAMYHEFVYPYYKRISERFGLLSYGCCEAVHTFWEDISRFDNLRKISVSPWCDEAFIGQALQGRKVVYLRKPSPNYLGVDRILDEDALRAYIRKTVEFAAGLTLEFSQRDVYTVHKDSGKVARYVEIIREECEAKK